MTRTEKPSPVFTPLTLPCGATVPNRIAKGAMEENLAEEGQSPGPRLIDIYRVWGEGGTGLLITGNVMIDPRALTSAGAVVLEKGTPIDGFKRWAQAAKAQGAQVWMQISHPGRQAGVSAGGAPWAPSAVALDMGRFSDRFRTPRAMTEAEIQEVITRFADTAAAAEAAGFDGVQIHAAHGYLISQFLSPLANQRADAWGGALENRARLLLEVVRAVRARVSAGFAVSVKLNSADFQRGGFDENDAAQVLAWLGGLPVDLVELSGGSYEAPAMQGLARDGRTLAREAYFLEFAQKLAAQARVPIMTTGGIRRLAVAEQVLQGGVQMVGIATALAIDPALPKRWQQGQTQATAELPPLRMKSKALASVAVMAVVKQFIHAMGTGRTPWRVRFPMLTLILDERRNRRLAQRYRRWVSAQGIADS